MAKVVYVDWKDRQFEPEIIGVYEDESKGYEARENKRVLCRLRQGSRKRRYGE